ncbi:hypothetical protein QYM36_019470 [Artemia franciscana]|uniref:Uncharacterized protein n=1 Tax=Artemia franciscana TaxID=6661 RepID=A0AA88HAJ5_ARTSF|nr:hypothetical protein QYM36_019470 [Artemia franciscana]
MSDVPLYDDTIEFRDKVPYLSILDEYDEEFTTNDAYKEGRAVLVTLENNDPESQEYKDANEKHKELNTRIEQDNKQRYELIRAQGYNPVTFTADEMMADLIAKTAVNSSPAKPQVAFIVQDGWLDPEELNEVRRVEQTEMPKKNNIKESKKRIANKKDDNSGINPDLIVVDIAKCSKVAKLIPMAAELVFRTRGHHYINELMDEYKQVTREIEAIIREESLITTIPAPGPSLNAPKPTLNAPEHNLTAPEPTLTAPKLTSPAPEPTLTVPELTLTVPEATLTAPRPTRPAPETHPASLIAPENDSRNPSMTLAVSKDVKRKRPRNFFTICQFCHRSLYKLDKHFLAKKGTCSKNPNGELWSVKEAKEVHELARDELAERSQNKSYFLASQVSSLVEDTKTLQGFCKALSALTGIYFDPLNLPDRALSFDDTRPVTLPAPGPATPEGTCTHTHTNTHTHTAHLAGPSTSALPQQSSPVLETDLFSGKPSRVSSQFRQRRVSEDSDPDDVVDSDEEGSLYAPQSPEHKSSESEEEKSKLRSQYYKKEWSYTSDVRKKMQKHGL